MSKTTAENLPRKKKIYTPLNALYPYQRKIVRDSSRFKIISCARQTGKSTVLACEASMDCCAHPGTRWLALSAGMRQSQEWLVKAQKWAQIWCEYFDRCNVPREIKSVSKTEIEFSNGAKITALPANPDTARGYTANLILDEFAYHEHPDEVWAAVVPSISNEIANKMKVRVASTVAGKQNKFWKLLEGAGEGQTWSKHIVNVLKAKEDGLPVDIPALRAGIADDDIWQQEYMCIPVDASSALLTFELISACEDAQATSFFNEREMESAGKHFVIGMDIGRRHDLTVIWTCERTVGDKLLTREILELDHVNLDEQQRILFGKLSHRNVECACIDATGIGYHLAENAEREFGSRVLRYNFTEQSKRDLFISMQRAFQNREILLPKNDDKLREDLHSMQRLFTSSGRILFSAPRNEDGHADRATACALAIMASKRTQEISDSAGTIDDLGDEDLPEGIPSIFGGPRFV